MPTFKHFKHFKHLKYPTASLAGRTGLRLTSLVSACLALCSLATPAWSLDLRQAYDAAYDNLILRVADAYFNVLTAIDSLAFARGEERAVKGQLDQA